MSFCFYTSGKGSSKTAIELAYLLGVLFVGLILVWLDWQTDKRVAAARLEGKAQCEAEFAKKEVVAVKKEKEVQNENNIKKAVIYSKPNANRDELLKLMHNNQL